jgi:hypothetical protein
VVNDADFKPANLMFNAMLVKLKQLGLAVTVHKPPIAKEDLGKQIVWPFLLSSVNKASDSLLRFT